MSSSLVRFFYGELMKNICKTLGLFLLVLGSTGNAETIDYGTINLSGDTFVYRDYPKRDRALVGSSKEVAPSQLHEVVGGRLDAAIEVSQTQLEAAGVKSRIDSPSISARYIKSQKRFIGALGLSYMDADLDSKDNYDEAYSSVRLVPQIAYGFSRYFTVGAAGILNWITVQENPNTAAGRKFDLEGNRIVASMSYNKPSFEVGFTYTSEAQDSDRSSQSEIAGYSLAMPTTDNRRGIYIPSHGAFFARGNLSDSFSIAGTAGMARYDGNNEAAITEFDRYRTADRVATRLQLTYWTAERTRFSTTAEYRGGATAEPGLDENALGYRAANLYGGSVEGTYSFNRKAYTGLLLGYLQGDRSIQAPGEKIKLKENNLRIVANASLKF